MAEDLFFLQDQEVYELNRENLSITIIWCGKCTSSVSPRRAPGNSVNLCKSEQRKTGAHPNIHTLPY